MRNNQSAELAVQSAHYYFTFLWRPARQAHLEPALVGPRGGSFTLLARPSRSRADRRALTPHPQATPDLPFPSRPWPPPLGSSGSSDIRVPVFSRVSAPTARPGVEGLGLCFYWATQSAPAGKDGSFPVQSRITCLLPGRAVADLQGRGSLGDRAVVRRPSPPTPFGFSETPEALLRLVSVCTFGSDLVRPF